MAQVIVTPNAQAKFHTLPRTIQGRVMNVLARLQQWPDVSGAKPLRGALAGNWRIRTGDYRIVFSVSPDDQVVTVWRIGYRGDVYD